MAVGAGLKSIRSTYLYEMMNVNGHMDNAIKNFLQKGIVPDEKKFERQLATINSYYKYPLKTVVLNAYQNRDIVPMLYPKGIAAENKMPLALPFLMRPSSNGVQGVAVIDNFAIDDSNLNAIMMDTQQFYTFLEATYIAREIQIRFNTIRNSSAFMRDAAMIFAHMFVRYLNKKYALNINKKAHEKVLYLAAKYFYINILQRTPMPMLNDYAKSVAKAVDLDDMMLSRIDDELAGATNGEPFKDISTFISGLSKIPHLLTPAFAELTVRDYIREYTLMYGNTCLFALEHFSYFIFNLIAAQNNSFIAKKGQYAIKDIMGKTGNSVYHYLCSVVRK